MRRLNNIQVLDLFSSLRATAATPSSNNESGFALPIALMLLLVLASSAAIFSQQSVQLINLNFIQETTHDTFHITEGVIHNQMRQMSLDTELWKTYPTFDSATPEGYTIYQPATYTANNGIPTCSGIGCARSLVPVGGGLLKNLGPIGSDGDSVDSSFSIDEQLDPDDLPEADMIINGRPAWVQVERLEKRLDPDNALGGNLSTQGSGYGNAEIVRFRLTGYSLRDIKSREGRSTVVSVIEFPAV